MTTDQHDLEEVVGEVDRGGRGDRYRRREDDQEEWQEECAESETGEEGQAGGEKGCTADDDDQ